MTATTTSSAPTADDTAAIKELHRLFAEQKGAFGKERYPGLADRLGHLEAVMNMLVTYRSQIREALTFDFSVHPERFTDVEVVSTLASAGFAMENLEKWMAPEVREADPGLFGSGEAAIHYQPKGVIGIIVPWNVPFYLSVGPLIDALAAGNRVIIKPSDYTPASGELLKEMLGATFGTDRVAVVTGGLELAKEFARQRWDHLLYTGNPEVAREIAKAAAENLVPTTLELGGKCPVFFLPDSVDAKSVGHIIGTKAVKNGQMCVSADYALVPRDKVAEFVSLAQAYAAEHMSDYSKSSHVTGIISQRHFDRLDSLVQEARGKGAEVIQLDTEGELDRNSRRMPLTIVVDPDENLGIMQQEIFGPILPVKPYDSLDEAIQYVNAGERPLALYVFSQDHGAADTVLAQTTSGGAGVNVCMVHAAIPGLTFGGSGTSGSGRYHGLDGFREFSNARGVLVRGEGDVIEALFPPYGQLADAVVTSILGS